MKELREAYRRIGETANGRTDEMPARDVARRLSRGEAYERETATQNSLADC
jgi:hypothetical protein